MKSAIQNALPVLAKGVPQFKFDGIDPIRIESLTIGEGTGQVHVVQNYKNVEIYNVPNATVQNVEATITDDEFQVVSDIVMDNVQMKAKYSLDGNILVMPIKGDGDCTVSLEDVKSKMTMIGEMFQKKNGKTYVEIKTFNVSLNPAMVRYDFENLFNGDGALGDSMNAVLNDNWQDIYEDVQPGYEEALGEVFKSLANLFFTKIPYDEMF
ncbi:hypothetical protein RI129_012389 [Pyrocoelia pectoralis]|uniref:Uncharacterized protein n=1 Tax=Pyrocoelia pectoralis TaxID=417401 RepID=A0AAN7V079_9COLE